MRIVWFFLFKSYWNGCFCRWHCTHIKHHGSLFLSEQNESKITLTAWLQCIDIDISNGNGNQFIWALAHSFCICQECETNQITTIHNKLQTKDTHSTSMSSFCLFYRVLRMQTDSDRQYLQWVNGSLTAQNERASARAHTRVFWSRTTTYLHWHQNARLSNKS